LIVSDMKMLRDFGFVTVVDLGVVMLGLGLLLPATLMVAEEGLQLRRTLAQAIAAVKSIGARARVTLGRVRAGAPFKK
jgi:hypothetical protein